MEKYGFVYIWFDKTRKMFYIGSHWGHESDGYICSSTWMRNTYKRRPNDFKRKILVKVYSNRLDLLEKEQKYIDMIKPNEFKIKYYNINSSVKTPWHAYPEKIKTIGQKISIKTKEAMQRPEVKQKYLDSLKNIDRIPTEKTIEKRRNSMKLKMAEKFPVENRRKRVKQNSEEHLKLVSEGVKRYHETMTNEQREKRKNSLSKSMLGKRNRAGKKNSEKHNEALKKATIERAQKKREETFLNIKNKLIDTLHLNCVQAGKELNITRQAVKRFRQMLFSNK